MSFPSSLWGSFLVALTFSGVNATIKKSSLWWCFVLFFYFCIVLCYLLFCMFFLIVLYHIVFLCVLSYCISLCFILLYLIVLYRSIFNFIVSYCISLYCISLYFIVWYHFVFLVFCSELNLISIIHQLFLRSGPPTHPPNTPHTLAKKTLYKTSITHFYFLSPIQFFFFQFKFHTCTSMCFIVGWGEALRNCHLPPRQSHSSNRNFCRRPVKNNFLKINLFYFFLFSLLFFFFIHYLFFFRYYFFSLLFFFLFFFIFFIYKK